MRNSQRRMCSSLASAETNTVGAGTSRLNTGTRHSGSTSNERMPPGLCRLLLAVLLAAFVAPADAADPATGTPLTGWQLLDRNPATRQIEAAGDEL